MDDEESEKENTSSSEDDNDDEDDDDTESDGDNTQYELDRILRWELSEDETRSHTASTGHQSQSRPSRALERLLPSI